MQAWHPIQTCHPAPPCHPIQTCHPATSCIASVPAIHEAEQLLPFQERPDSTQLLRSHGTGSVEVSLTETQHHPQGIRQNDIRPYGVQTTRDDHGDVLKLPPSLRIATTAGYNETSRRGAVNTRPALTSSSTYQGGRAMAAHNSGSPPESVGNWFGVKALLGLSKRGATFHLAVASPGWGGGDATARRTGRGRLWISLGGVSSLVGSVPTIEPHHRAAASDVDLRERTRRPLRCMCLLCG